MKHRWLTRTKTYPYFEVKKSQTRDNRFRESVLKTTKKFLALSPEQVLQKLEKYFGNAINFGFCPECLGKPSDTRMKGLEQVEDEEPDCDGFSLIEFLFDVPISSQVLDALVHKYGMDRLYLNTHPSHLLPHHFIIEKITNHLKRTGCKIRRFTRLLEVLLKHEPLLVSVESIHRCSPLTRVLVNLCDAFECQGENDESEIDDAVIDLSRVLIKNGAKLHPVPMLESSFPERDLVPIRQFLTEWFPVSLSALVIQHLEPGYFETLLPPAPVFEEQYFDEGNMIAVLKKILNAGYGNVYTL